MTQSFPDVVGTLVRDPSFKNCAGFQIIAPESVETNAPVPAVLLFKFVISIPCVPVFTALTNETS